MPLFYVSFYLFSNKSVIKTDTNSNTSCNLFFDLFRPSYRVFTFFFFNDTATTEIYTLSLHDALPICDGNRIMAKQKIDGGPSVLYDAVVILFSEKEAAMLANEATAKDFVTDAFAHCKRSEEHTSELQSRPHLVCRLLLEKKKKKKNKK